MRYGRSLLKNHSLQVFLVGEILGPLFVEFFVVLVFIFHFGTVYQRQQLFAKFCFPDHYGAKSERI